MWGRLAVGGRDFLRLFAVAKVPPFVSGSGLMSVDGDRNDAPTARQEGGRGHVYSMNLRAGCEAEFARRFRGPDGARRSGAHESAVRPRRRRFQETPTASAILLAILTAACATGGAAHVTVGTTLTPGQEAGLADVKAFVETAARAYQVQPPAIMVADHAWEATAGAVYRRGVIVFTSRMLTSPSRDKATAHELGHYFLRHDQPSSRPSEEIEHQANIEAVRILQTAKGLSEEAALRVVVEALDRTHGAVKAGAGLTRGHAHPCEEIRAVVAAYPAQRAWTATLECVPTQWGQR
jgi:hypothetical protein